MCMAIISKFSSIFSISEQKQEETTLLFCLIPTSRRTYLYNLRNYQHIAALYLPILKRFLKIELICSTSRYLHLISICICAVFIEQFRPQILAYLVFYLLYIAFRTFSQIKMDVFN